MVVLIGDIDAFLKRKRGQGGGEAKGLQPGSWWFTCHLFHLCRIFFFSFWLNGAALFAWQHRMLCAAVLNALPLY